MIGRLAAATTRPHGVFSAITFETSTMADIADAFDSAPSTCVKLVRLYLVRIAPRRA